MITKSNIEIEDFYHSFPAMVKRLNFIADAIACVNKGMHEDYYVGAALLVQDVSDNIQAMNDVLFDREKVAKDHKAEPLNLQAVSNEL